MVMRQPGTAPVRLLLALLCLPSQVQAMLALVLASIVWGTADVAGKAALGTIPPMTLTALRFIVALAILWPLCHYRGARPILGGQGALLGVTGVALTFLFLNQGLAQTTAATASLLQGSSSVIVLLLSALFLGEEL